MQLLVNPINFINALKLIKLGVHQLYVGSKLFSLRNNCNLSINSLKRLVENKTKTKIIILINKIIQEDEIKSLEQYILSICKLNIDGIMFTDYAVAQIIYEHKIKINLIYFSPTLTTNYGQIDFFESNKINEIVLSNELNKIEIKDICKHKSKVKIQLQVFGHVHVMNSKWNLLPNNTNKQLYLKEENRKEPMIIYNDNKGTQIMSSFVLSLLDKFNEIKTIGIDTLRIDSWLINKKQLMEEVLNWLNLFNQKSNKFKITNSYHNFWDMNKKDLIYLKNEYEK